MRIGTVLPEMRQSIVEGYGVKCPRCRYEWRLPGPQAGGRAKVKKGFADPSVQAKAQATRKRKARDGHNAR